MKKTTMALLIPIAAMIWGSCSGVRMSAEEKQLVQDRIANRDFRIDVNQAYPSGGRSIPLTSPYSLTVRGDSVFSYLPYFGRAYNIPYGGGAGLNFEGIMTDYRTESGKREFKIVEFNVKSPDDRIVYRLEIGPEGGTTITVQPQNRQLISFSGQMNTTANN